VSGKAVVVVVVSATLGTGAAVAPVGAQSAASQAPEPVRAAAPRQNQPAQQPREQRYQIGVMERVLEGAVEHGASIVRDRLDPVLQSQTMLLENARVRGFRLDGYGVFFDAEVPSLEISTLYSAFRTLDQNGLGLESALKALKSYIEASGDVDLEQALRRIEVQIAPSVQVAPTTDILTPRTVGSSTVTRAAGTASEPVVNDPILRDPLAAFHAEVIKALSDAMLDHSGPLDIAVDEWLTVAARGNEVRPRIGPLDSNAQTFIVSVRGSDLTAFRAGQLSREDAIKRVEVRVF
jgi:hypothetical protein